MVLSSVTYALKAQDLLKKEGVYSVLTRAGTVRAVKGCGYGLEVAAANENIARRVLYSANINLLGVVS
jgi:hypothetical protein